MRVPTQAGSNVVPPPPAVKFVGQQAETKLDIAIVCAIINGKVGWRELLANPKNVSFTELVALCEEHFGEFRISGSHHVFKTPWSGDPRINLQKDGAKAKPYQVQQVRKAIEKLERRRMR